MRWLDNRFKANRANYVLQSLMALGVVFVMSMFIDIVLRTTTVASLGATVFIAFTMPHTRRSGYRYLLGGYTIGITAGTVMSYVMVSDNIYMKSLSVAIAVGLAIFFMVITNTEHPPAAGLAMGIVIEGINWQIIIVIYSCLIILLFFKEVLSKWLIDLVEE